MSTRAYHASGQNRHLIALVAFAILERAPALATMAKELSGLNDPELVLSAITKPTNGSSQTSAMR